MRVGADVSCGRNSARVDSRLLLACESTAGRLLRKNACPVRFTVLSAQSRFEIFGGLQCLCIAQERGFDSADQEGWCPEKSCSPARGVFLSIWEVPRERGADVAAVARTARGPGTAGAGAPEGDPGGPVLRLGSERSQPQTAPLPPPPNVISLPQPQAGYVWQQVPAVPQMMTAAQAPKAIVHERFSAVLGPKRVSSVQLAVSASADEAME